MVQEGSYGLVEKFSSRILVSNTTRFGKRLLREGLGAYVVGSREAEFESASIRVFDSTTIDWVPVRGRVRDKTWCTGVESNTWYIVSLLQSPMQKHLQLVVFDKIFDPFSTDPP